MAKNPIRHPPAPAALVAKRRRGRPPSPNGPKSQAEIQRAYRARLAAAGKVVRLIDAVVVSPAPANQELAGLVVTSVPKVPFWKLRNFNALQPVRPITF
jgi:hypothetical protein